MRQNRKAVKRLTPKSKTWPQMLSRNLSQTFKDLANWTARASGHPGASICSIKTAC